MIDLNRISSEDKETLNKIKDKLMICQKREIISYTDFLNPYQMELCRSLIKVPNGIRYFFFGGFSQAERQIMVIHPDFIDKQDIDIPIKAIQVSSNAKSCVFQHKDVLGATLGLGIRREKVGDIVTVNSHANIFLSQETAEYVLLFLQNVGKYSVFCEEIPLDQLYALEMEYRVIPATVASLRVDAVISGGLGLSRSSANQYVKSGKIKINHREIINPAFMVKEGDLISVKGKGRIILDKIDGTTKKERIKIKIKKVL